MYIRRRRSGSVELQVKHKLLPRGVYHGTFDDEGQARDFGLQLERMLAAGTVPPDLLAAPAGDNTRLAVLIRDFMSTQAMRPWLEEVLQLVRADVADVPLERAMTYKWAEQWLRELKQRRLVPGTIRKRVSALALVMDWHVRRTEGKATNPLRVLPPGYSTYSELDRKLAKIRRDVDVPVDTKRDRRLNEGEEDQLRAALAGTKRPDRQRPLGLPEREALQLLFDLALETGMRLGELVTLGVDQVDLAKRTINLRKTKNGDTRQVPLTTVARSLLEAWLRRHVGMVFPWYLPVHGDEARDRRERKRVTTRISQQFRSIADYAGCEDLTFHDLRHEAACRVYERTRMGDVQVARMFGWRDLRMCVRYASLRGSDLAAGLW